MQFAGILFLLSCQNNQETKVETRQDTTTSSVKSDTANKTVTAPAAAVSSSPFLDSVARQDELTIDQIKTHTGIDSVYYTDYHAESVFTGDSVFKLQNGLTVAIIKYDDRRNCIYRFLLVFDATANNTSNMVVVRDCDQDESSDYTTLDYKITGNAGFETTETFIPANNAPGKKKTVQRYTIDDAGKIKKNR